MRKDGMKKLLMGLGLIVLLAGCASRDNMAWAEPVMSQISQ
jgi:uncharacterized lipoprotein YajG